MAALHLKIRMSCSILCGNMGATNRKHKMLRTECEIIIKKLLSIVDHTKEDLKMGKWVHMPQTSDEYQFYRLLCGTYEGPGFESLAMVLSIDMNEASAKSSMAYFLKARTIYSLLGMKDELRDIEPCINMAKVQLAMFGGGRNTLSASALLQNVVSKRDLNAKSEYERNKVSFGLTSVKTMEAGLWYVGALVSAQNAIEAEQLAAKLAADCRRVHGLEHKITISADEVLKDCKTRYVFVMPERKRFQALRYENDGKICVVTGPIPVTGPRNVDNEKMLHFENGLIMPSNGCPVICHGLLSASHLNGKLGDVRTEKLCGNEIRLAVHFEDKSLKSALVKPENVRIAFELASKE